MRTQTIKVTPKLAERWLKKNASNRNVSEVRVGAYARDMARGKWFLAPHGLVFNVKGDLLDGQHRLFAVIRSGKTVRMAVSRGVDHDVRKFIDRGRPRNFGDVLRMGGVEKRVVLKAAISRNLVSLDRGSVRDMVTMSEQEECIAKYSTAFAWLDTATLSNGYIRAPYLACVMWALSLDVRVQEFHEGVQTGLDLRHGSPALAMRSYLAQSPSTGWRSQNETLLKASACVLAALEGASVQQLRYASKGYLALAKRLGRKLPTHGTLVLAQE